MVAFNTTSGIPITQVRLMNADGRAASLASDGNSNQAEAGTMSMEFTTIGRLLGAHKHVTLVAATAGAWRG
jgi:hypothetical protein